MNRVEQYVEEMYARGREGDMFAEAQAQWLESCLEAPVEQQREDLLDDVEGWALYWLEGLMNDCSDEELEPGGLYHWMVVATEQAEDWEY